MANILAAATGNWSATGTWIGGVLPGSADVVYANGFTVTIDQDITVVELRADSNGGVATGSGAFTVAAANGVTRSIAAKLTNSNLTASPSSGGTVNITGALTSALYHAVIFAGAGTVNVTGSWASSMTENAITSAVNVNLTGNLVYSGAAHGLAFRGANGAFKITGDVTNSSNGASGFLMAGSSGALTVTGTITGASTNPGVWINALGHTLYATQVTGGSGGPGVLASSGTAYITRATGGTGGVGVSASSSSTVYVEEIEYGSTGQSPTSGLIRLTDKTSNKCLFFRQGLSKKTVSDIAGLGVLPAVTDVRSGVSYNAGQLTGTCAVPAASLVASGAAIDATTGTGAIGATAMQSACAAALTAFASGRLANVATVASTGQQIADAAP
jgi:hypothetical protein